MPMPGIITLVESGVCAPRYSTTLTWRKEETIYRARGPRDRPSLPTYWNGLTKKEWTCKQTLYADFQYTRGQI